MKTTADCWIVFVYEPAPTGAWYIKFPVYEHALAYLYYCQRYSHAIISPRGKNTFKDSITKTK